MSIQTRLATYKKYGFTGKARYSCKNAERKRYLDSFDGYRVSDADRMGHTGWACDDFHHNIAIGVVIQLPSRGRKTLYLAGVRFSECEGATLFVDRIYDTREQAARAADKKAEAIAEVEREYQENFQKKLHKEDLQEGMVADRAKLQTLISELRHARNAVSEGNAPTICDILRREIKKLRARIANAKKEIADLAIELQQFEE